MSDINNILALSKKYLDAHQDRSDRIKSWTTDVASRVEMSLNNIVTELTSKNDYFKSNLFVNKYSFSINFDDERLTIKNMPSVSLNSGTTFVAGFSDVGNIILKNISENGFQIHFTPLYNGKIHVYAIGHSIDNGDYNNDTIEIIDDPNELVEQKIIDLVYSGLEKIHKTSFLFQ